MFYNNIINNNTKFLLQLSLAVILAVFAIYVQAQKETPNARIGEGCAYMSIAKTLADNGIFTNGTMVKKDTSDKHDNAGMFFAPLYPALLSVIMKFDKTFYDTVSCHVTAKNPATNCAHDFGILGYVQIALASLSTLLIWLAGFMITKRYSAAWLAMGISLLAEAYAYYTAQIMTENLVFPLFSATCLFIVFAWKYKKTWPWFLAGISLGLLALTRPSFVYLFYFGIITVSFLSGFQNTASFRKKLGLPLLFLIGYAGIVTPWIIRNGQTFGQYSISKGYAPFILVQRIAYNDMSWKEWAVSFVYGLPDFGDSLAEDLFNKKDYERFDYSNPEGFYLIGNSVLREKTEKAAGGRENHLAYLVKHGILENPFKHTIVTLSLAWRGMWVSQYWGLVTILLFSGVFIYALRRKWWEFVIFSVPPWFMLGFHAFTSVNVVRYNLILIPCLSISAAFLFSVGFLAIHKYLVKFDFYRKILCLSQ
ncbi:MAG: hypothetical protein KAJ40_06375 [Alphaproteobacteria bacterium]|nr:hypothetical protein [Alphaproteobacteria bacterium]